MRLEFEAVITEVKARLTTSNDREYSLKVITENANVLALGAIDAQQTVKITIEVAN